MQVCLIVECKGKLRASDNYPKTPKGLFRCTKCGSVFRMIHGLRGNHLVTVTNNFYNQPTKQIKTKSGKKSKSNK